MYPRAIHRGGYIYIYIKVPPPRFFHSSRQFEDCSAIWCDGQTKAASTLISFSTTMTAKSSSTTTTTTTVASLLFVVILAILWMYWHRLEASAEVWIPLPLFGYLRQDVAVAGFVCIQLPMMVGLVHGCLGNKLSKWHWMLVICFWSILILTPYLPDRLRPLVYTRPPSLFLKYLDVNPNATVTEHVTGLSNEISARMVAHTLAHAPDWTHVTKALCLGYFQYGPSHNFDRKYRYTKSGSSGLWDLFVYGFQMNNPARQARESNHRLRHPHVAAPLLPVLYKHVLEPLRDVYKNTLNATTIVYGNELTDGLGVPAVTIMLPNFVWQWLANVHTDAGYATVFQEKASHSDCVAVDQPVRTLLIPLTVPPGAGLRYWTSPVWQQVDYQLGHVYTFDATLIHAIRPLRNHAITRMTIQAFGTECTDGRWIVYH